MTSENTIKNCETKMKKAFEVFNNDLSSLRTGRANASMLDIIKVDVYGQKMSVNQLATITTPEPRLLTVQVWDKGLVSSVEKAIRESDLGLNPASEGQLIRVPIPALNEERRVEITKIAGKYAEETRVAVRNVRRNAMDDLKKAEKDGNISKDEHREYDGDVQAITDEFIRKVDETLNTKEQEIMQV